LREDAAAVQIVGCFVPVLLQTRDEVLEADRDRAPLIVLHLHRRTVEAEELPHLLGRERDRSFLELLLELVARRRQRQHDERVGGNPARKRADRRHDGRAARDLEPRARGTAGPVRRAAPRTARRARASGWPRWRRRVRPVSRGEKAAVLFLRLFRIAGTENAHVDRLPWLPEAGPRPRRATRRFLRGTGNLAAAPGKGQGSPAQASGFRLQASGGALFSCSL
jgi:hypothetical protein